MAQPTNFITNNPPYINRDLNTIFAPIGVNVIDYGGLGNYSVGDAWTTFTNISKDNTGGNVTTTATPVLNKGFRINSAGLYRLNISLNFGSITKEISPVNIAFILSSTSAAPASYGFTPSPNMSTIYAINCSGACGTTGNAVNYLNSVNLENCLSLNHVQTNITTDPYFFSFPLIAASVGQTGSNFFTLDITFTASFEQLIYPYIRCKESTAFANLQNSTWRFVKLNNMPA